MNTKEWVLWGWTSRFGADRPLRITSGSLRDCRSREKQFHADYPDALTGIYESGDVPEGLALQVQERRGDA